jgi:hypothetical protein
MDESGIAAEVIFAGGQNGEVLPFVGVGWDAGPSESPQSLRAVEVARRHSVFPVLVANTCICTSPDGSAVATCGS